MLYTTLLPASICLSVSKSSQHASAMILCSLLFFLSQSRCRQRAKARVKREEGGKDPKRQPRARGYARDTPSTWVSLSLLKTFHTDFALGGRELACWRLSRRDPWGRNLPRAAYDATSCLLSGAHLAILRGIILGSITRWCQKGSD